MSRETLPKFLHRIRDRRSVTRGGPLAALVMGVALSAARAEVPLIDNSVEVRTLPAGRWVYLAHTGPYWTVGPRLEQVRTDLLGKDPTDRRVLVRYLDDPRTSRPAELRAEIGRRAQLSSQPELPFRYSDEGSLTALAVPKPDSLHSLRRLLPMLEAQARARGLVPAGPALEVYDFDAAGNCIGRTELWLPVTAYPEILENPSQADAVGTNPPVASPTEASPPEGFASPLSSRAAARPPLVERSNPYPTAAAIVESHGPGQEPGTSESAVGAATLSLGGLDKPAAAEVRDLKSAEGSDDTPQGAVDVGGIQPPAAGLRVTDSAVVVASESPAPASLNVVDRLLPAGRTGSVDCSWVAQLVLRVRALARAAAHAQGPDTARLAVLAQSLDQRFQLVCHADAKQLGSAVGTTRANSDSRSSAHRDLLQQIDRLLGRTATGGVTIDFAAMELERLLDLAAGVSAREDSPLPAELRRQ